MGRRRNRGRPVDGVILLDKPSGITSNRAVQIVKRLFNANKVGHTGSLDPLASGMLPLCLGEATKVSSFLLDADKHYRVVCRLGRRTDTGDAEGEVIETRPVEAYGEARMRAVLAGFVGEIEQIPPMYSALKHQGERLYKLAREGKEVERKPRPVTIHALDLLDYEDDRLSFDVRCSKGTYVRTLAEDIGGVLGCGAYVEALRRVGVDPYDNQAMVTIEELEALADEGFAALDASLLPIDTAIRDWPEVRLNADSAYYLRQGQPIQVPKSPTAGWVRIYGATSDGGERFLGLGEIDDHGRVAPRRLIASDA
ncbi:tRNA pseudouridine(55) synthase TruB [Endothiovibrio diazotrophicus]